MKDLGSIAASFLLIGCVPDQDPMRYEAALVIPMDAKSERLELVKILNEVAQRHADVHIDDVTEQAQNWYDETPIVEPYPRPNIEVTMWRGSEDDELFGRVTDKNPNGMVLATFNRGESIALASDFRSDAIAAIRKKWPNTKDHPITETGGLNFEDSPQTDP